MLSFSSVEDVIIFHGVKVIFFNSLMLSFSSVGDVVIFHGVKVINFEGPDGCYHFQ
jgi:hypothetical protein